MNKMKKDILFQDLNRDGYGYVIDYIQTLENKSEELEEWKEKGLAMVKYLKENKPDAFMAVATEMSFLAEKSGK